MIFRALRTTCIGTFAALFMLPGHTADMPREMHGSADAFAAPGMALAWGVLRGATEDATLVVIRIVTDSAVFTDVAVTGSDPFTARQQSMLALTSSTSGVVEVRTPRAHFAEYPRTELRFFGSALSPTTVAPSLVVFFLGVPDTTPEFTDEAKLDAYLRERIAQLKVRKRP
jgi:hypothetical protein